MRDRVIWAISIGTVLGLIVIIYTPLNRVLKLAPLSGGQFLTAIAISIIAVLWYELVKLARLKGNRNVQNHERV
jgi:Ca2+-transporting ATPase